jgi:hypothetical protein
MLCASEVCIHTRGHLGGFDDRKRPAGHTCARGMARLLTVRACGLVESKHVKLAWNTLISRSATASQKSCCPTHPVVARRSSLRRPLRFAARGAWPRGPGPRAAVADRDRGRQVIGGRDSRRSDSAGRGAVTLISNILRGARRLTPPQSPGRAPKTRKTNPHSGSARHALTFDTKCRGHMSHVSFAGCITQVAPARRTAGGKGRPSTANCLSVGYSLIFSQPPRNEARSLGATHLASTTASRH